jgi:hypothetical protein
MRSTSRKSRAKSVRRRAAPRAVNGTVPPRLTAYSKRRKREYLTVKEVERLIDTARSRGRYESRLRLPHVIAPAPRPLGRCSNKNFAVVDDRLSLHEKRVPARVPRGMAGYAAF